MINAIASAVVLAVGLAMDAFAVSMCKGLAVKKLKWSHMIITGLYFGIFQAIMPTIGYLLGTSFESYISSVDHWVAFVLLGIIGFNMIKESFSKEEEQQGDSFGIDCSLYRNRQSCVHTHHRIQCTQSHRGGYSGFCL